MSVTSNPISLAIKDKKKNGSRCMSVTTSPISLAIKVKERKASDSQSNAFLNLTKLQTN